LDYLIPSSLVFDTYFIMSVNVPTDSKQKEKDINQKLQLFGIYHAFKNSKLPSVRLNPLLSSLSFL
jgi:hypothetical protein